MVVCWLCAFGDSGVEGVTTDWPSGDFGDGMHGSWRDADASAAVGARGLYRNRSPVCGDILQALCVDLPPLSLLTASNTLSYPRKKAQAKLNTTRHRFPLGLD
jgi:hypothetical protein